MLSAGAILRRVTGIESIIPTLWKSNAVLNWRTLEFYDTNLEQPCSFYLSSESQKHNSLLSITAVAFFITRIIMDRLEIFGTIFNTPSHISETKEQRYMWNWRLSTRLASVTIAFVFGTILLIWRSKAVNWFSFQRYEKVLALSAFILGISFVTMNTIADSFAKDLSPRNLEYLPAIDELVVYNFLITSVLRHKYALIVGPIWMILHASVIITRPSGTLGRLHTVFTLTIAFAASLVAGYRRELIMRITFYITQRCNESENRFDLTSYRDMAKTMTGIRIAKQRQRWNVLMGIFNRPSVHQSCNAHYQRSESVPIILSHLRQQERKQSFITSKSHAYLVSHSDSHITAAENDELFPSETTAGTISSYPVISKDSHHSVYHSAQIEIPTESHIAAPQPSSVPVNLDTQSKDPKNLLPYYGELTKNSFLQQQVATQSSAHEERTNWRKLLVLLRQAVIHSFEDDKSSEQHFLKYLHRRKQKTFQYFAVLYCLNCIAGAAIANYLNPADRLSLYCRVIFIPALIVTFGVLFNLPIVKKRIRLSQITEIIGFSVLCAVYIFLGFDTYRRSQLQPELTCTNWSNCPGIPLEQYTLLLVFPAINGMLSSAYLKYIFIQSVAIVILCSIGLLPWTFFQIIVFLPSLWLYAGSVENENRKLFTVLDLM
ncbi:hypothetical protein BKA69DRAFT_1094306, partial [Paraphysoderma sedebokerense]